MPVVYWIIAAVVGFAVGWFAAGRYVGRRLHTAYAARLKTAEDHSAEMEGRLSEALLERDRYRSEMAGARTRLGAAESDLAASNARAAELEGAVQAESAARSQAVARVAGLERQVSSLTDAHGEAQARIAGLEGELTATATERAEALSRVGDLQVVVREKDTELGEAAAKAARLRADITGLGADAATKDRRISALETELAGLTNDLQEARTRLASTRTTDDAPVLRAGRAGSRETTVVSLPSGRPDAATGPSREVAVEKVAEIADRTAGAGPVPDDDLKLIRGIGPKIERILKDLGITSFKQIAAFQTDDIAYVEAALGAFPGRIERDDWMAGAAILHTEHHGARV